LIDPIYLFDPILVSSNKLNLHYPRFLICWVMWGVSTGPNLAS